MKRLIFIILFLGAVLRFFDLPNSPTLALRNDEAAVGYNAYSILKTGKDEHGNFLPLTFKAFGDWKMGAYVYIIVPFVAVLGLNETAVRLPYALVGILSILFFFGVALELFNKKTAIVASLLLAISPLFVPISRGAWDITVALTLAGIYFFLKSVKGKSSLFLLSTFFFGISLISSQGAKISTPVIFGLLLLIFFKDFKKIAIPIILLGFLIISLFAYPVILSFTTGKVTRITTLSVFSYPTNEEPFFYYSKKILSNWSNVYTFKSLFLKGDLNPQHGAPNVGPFLLMDAIFLLLGFIKIVQTNFTKQSIFILSSLFLLALPSALTIEKVNFERILTLFIPLILIQSLGAIYLWEKFKKKKLILTIFVVLYIGNYIYFLDQLFLHKVKQDTSWQHKQLVDVVTPYQKKYEKIIMQQSLEHPYIFFLFHQKYDPKKYQDISAEVFVPSTENKDMGSVSRLDNVYFQDINWLINPPEKEVLYVMPKNKLDEFSKKITNYEVVEDIKDRYGHTYYIVVEVI